MNEDSTIHRNGRCTNFPDKEGKLLYEHDLCRSWHKSGISDNTGFWLIEVIKYCNGDWYLFEVGHEYLATDDQPVKLKDYHSDLELCRRADKVKI